MRCRTGASAIRQSLLVVSGLLLILSGQIPAAELPSLNEIDDEAERLMATQAVKGMALAVIDDGRVHHVAAYGYRNVERRLPLETGTVVYGASLTKTAFAYMVLQLVEEELFELDRPLHEYLSEPIPGYDDYADLAGDDRWRVLTARHVLTHATGFANFRWLEEDGRLRFHFEPGDRYAYSGEGFYLLQFVLEEGLGLDVKAEMQRRVFDRFGMATTSMQWRPDFADNLADGYGIDGSYEPHDQRSNASAAGSMDTTIGDQARMWTGILNGDGLSAGSRAELVRPQLAIRSAHQFPTLIEATDSRAQHIELSAGLGLVTFDAGDGRVWFKGGHNPWTGNMVICHESERRCIVLLSNSVRAELIYPELARFVLGDIGMPWWWEYDFAPAGSMQ
jgi:CubicO group peptidase (beta-lactamase class C family)